MIFLFWVSFFLVFLFKLELNCENVVSFLYCEYVSFNVFVIFFIVLICVELLIFDIDILGLIVGFIFE